MNLRGEFPTYQVEEKELLRFQALSVRGGGLYFESPDNYLKFPKAQLYTGRGI